MLTALTEDGQGESTAMEVTSLVDTWLLLRNTERNGERNRLLYVIKSRGTAHSNQVREFALTDRGAELLDVYVGPAGVLTGSARMAQLADERAAATARAAHADRRGSALARRTAQVEQQITALREELAADRFDLDQYVEQDIATDVGRDADRAAMAAHRWADPAATIDTDKNMSRGRVDRRAGRRGVQPSALCCRAEPEVNSRNRESAADLRNPPGGSIPRGGDRPAGESRNWPAVTKSSPCQHWSAPCRSRSAPSSVICPTPTGCSSACSCAPKFGQHREEPACRGRQ